MREALRRQLEEATYETDRVALLNLALELHAAANAPTSPGSGSDAWVHVAHVWNAIWRSLPVG